MGWEGFFVPYENQTPAPPHSLTLTERASMSVTGVEEIVRFDEDLVVMSTVRGELSVHGRGLKVDMLDKSGGALRLSGSVDELVYSKAREDKGGFWSRLWS